MKRREDGAVREVMKELLRSDLRFHKTDCGRSGAMTAWGLKDTSSRPAKDLGGTLWHTIRTVLRSYDSRASGETVVLLSQQKPDDTIEIDLDLDELDATSAELKATYQEIKDYVLKEFGLKVSSLYISQVKRKCGIEVGENYNLPKSENARVPQCPKEKEDAIKAALKYFAMI